ncbi:MAG: hypothetical protein ACE5HI_09930, partial [bacterium]
AFSDAIFLFLTVYELFRLSYFIIMSNNFNKVLFSHEEVLRNVERQQAAAPPTENSLKSEDIQNVLLQSSELSRLDIRINVEDNYVWCFGEAYTWYQKEMIGKLVTSIPDVESVDLQGIVVTHQYVTKPGDNLGAIAQKVYGDAQKWPHIFQANKHIIDNPDNLQSDTRLFLPEDFK